jgi:hypothetical protein
MSYFPSPPLHAFLAVVEAVERIDQLDLGVVDLLDDRRDHRRGGSALRVLGDVRGAAEHGVVDVEVNRADLGVEAGRDAHGAVHGRERLRPRRGGPVLRRRLRRCAEAEPLRKPAVGIDRRQEEGPQHRLRGRRERAYRRHQLAQQQMGRSGARRALVGDGQALVAEDCEDAVGERRLGVDPVLCQGGVDQRFARGIGLGPSVW